MTNDPSAAIKPRSTEPARENVRHRRQDRRALPPRLDPSRRRRDRRDRPLDEIVPLYRDPRSDMPVTQFDYEDAAEKAGLVKFDFLGLKTLTVIAKARRTAQGAGIELDTQNIAFDDSEILRDAGQRRQRGRVPARRLGMRDLLRKMKPGPTSTIWSRGRTLSPGPMDSIPKYIA